MIEIEYQTAFLIPSALDLLRFKKKLTVTGISGNTQGVITASNPVPKQIKKILQSDSSDLASGAKADTLLVAGILSVKFASPLGNSASFLASQAKDPLKTKLSAFLVCNEYSKLTESANNR